MAKQAIGVKLDPEKVQTLKEQCARDGMTVSDYLNDAIDHQTINRQLEDKITKLNDRIQYLEDRHARLTGTPPKYEKRVSISMTLEQYNRFTELADISKMTKSELVRSLIPTSNQQLTGTPQLAG